MTDREEFRSRLDAWTKPCSGHTCSGLPVPIEAPYRPFNDVNTAPESDHWRTLFASDPLPDNALKALGVATPNNGATEPKFLELQLRVRDRVVRSSAGALALLQQVHSVADPLSFEIVRARGATTVQFACSADDSPIVLSALRAFDSELEVTQTRGFLEDTWRDRDDNSVIGFGLLEPW